MKKDRDPIAFIGQMVTRLGVTVALILGLGMLLGLWGQGLLLMIHIVFGALAVFGMVLVAVRYVLARKATGGLLIGPVIAFVGAFLALNGKSIPYFYWYHLLLMVAATGLVEANVARINRG